MLVEFSAHEGEPGVAAEIMMVLELADFLGVPPGQLASELASQTGDMEFCLGLLPFP